MTTTYKTQAGDMWDMIAWRVYGSTANTAKLMKANPGYVDMFFLPAGLTLDVPELAVTDVDATFVPPWRK